jgi:hypothetical protein
MTLAAARAAVAVLLSTVAAAGCGVGPGESQEGEADLVVTRDFGAERVATGELEDPTPSDTVVRFLDANAEIDTDYGGNFVSTIDGLEGSTVNGGDEDWFFFVNGIYSEIGAGEAKVNPGDRIWWDYRQWQEAYRVPAVVGSWPEPFLHGYDGKVRSVVIECVTAETQACDDVVGALEDEGIEIEREEAERPVEHPDSIRVLVGAWERLRADRAARQLEAGPSTSGVYAEVEACGDGWALAILGDDGRPRAALTDGGLVAAVRQADDEPTWLVTAAREEDLVEAAELVDAEVLADRYAVAASAGGEPQPVPAPSESPVIEAPACP